MSLKRNLCGLSLAILTFTIADSIRAATIAPIEQDRFIVANVFSRAERSAPDFGPWSAEVDQEIPQESSASASQDSTIGNQQIEAAGSASSFDFAFAASVFDLTFSVDTPVAYRFEGVYFDGGPPSFPPPATAFLEAEDGTRLQSVSGVFDVEGMLTPGIYRLRAGVGTVAEIGGGGSGGFDFLFVIPEPGTGALLAGGLALLGTARRRTRDSGPRPRTHGSNTCDPKR